ncbi:MFS transporter [Actinospica robiniae]|uniref:MFS transporter n=1 Tax=Actinospica robiniae TaxID=304901 RepID=UPI00040A38AB|nr:MFS transporter [Actinospica robiniae]
MTATTRAQAEVGTTYRWRWLGLAALLTGEAMNLLDSTIVQVAAPVMHARLGGSAADVQWFSSAYTLPFALLLVTGGRLGDIAGRRRIFRIGVVVFMLASLGCALAPTAGVLICLRVVQGCGAALIIPQTIGLIKTMFQGPEMSKALGSIGPVMGLAAVSGPILGAVLTHANLFGTSWRAVFLVNVPLSLGVLAAAQKLMEDRAPRRPGIDPVGTVLVMAGVGLIVYPLINVGSGRLSAGEWAAMAGGAVILAVFALQQRHAAAAGRLPLVEVSLLRDRTFPAALVTSTLFFGTITGLTLVIVLELQMGADESVLTAGLTLVPWSVGSGVASWIAGARLVGRYGHKLTGIGLAVMLVGLAATLAVYHQADPSGSYPKALPVALAVVGVGGGLFSPTFFTTALHQVRPQEIGSAAGLLNAVQQLGATLGVAVLGSVYFLSARSGRPETALHAIQVVFLGALAVIALTVPVSALMVRRSR